MSGNTNKFWALVKLKIALFKTVCFSSANMLNSI